LRLIPAKVETRLVDRSEGAHPVAIDKERRHFFADVASATPIHHRCLGEWHPRLAPQGNAEWFGGRRAVRPSDDKVRPDFNLYESCPGVQPTCYVASGSAHDYRAELVACDRDLGYRDHMAVGKALESSVADKQLRGLIELVGQTTLAELDPAVRAAVGSVGIDLDHAGILLQL
jgi:hypothetical protein